MTEKVNPMHPDKIADRIAGAIVDMAYREMPDPKIAVEVLIGHGVCHIIAETSVVLSEGRVMEAVRRITGRGDLLLDLQQYPQDPILARNQSREFRCGDNGIFKGMPLTEEEQQASWLAREIYRQYKSDGKYIVDLNRDGHTHNRVIICQSNVPSAELRRTYPEATVNPLGDWTGGLDTDTGATNRKLGSDMGRSVTGGGLHGKDLSKADVTVNIHAFLKAQAEQREVSLCCAIGDAEVDGMPYCMMVEEARRFVESLGGFERLAEWGLF